MDQTENNENQKKKNRYLPIIWIGGAGLAGAILVLGIMYARKQGEVRMLTKQLADTTTVFIREKEALDNELAQSATRYDSLMTGYNLLNKGFAEQKNRNRLLVKENTEFAVHEKECKKEYTALQGTAEQLRNENEILKSDRDALRSQSDMQQAQLTYRDSLISAQMAMLGIQDNKLRSDSAFTARLMDSIQYENASGYFNSTELNGAYGLAKIDIPYSHYFFGLTTVNGYAVNRHLFTGLGVGLLGYSEGLSTPIYLDFRYHFGRGGFNPYIFTDCGFTFKYKENFEFPMVFFNPGLGFCKSLSDRLGLNVGAGILVQRDDKRSSFVNLKLGFVFLKNGRMKPWAYRR